MRSHLILLFFVLGWIAQTRTATAAYHPAALYGPDDRKDLIQVQDPLALALSWSTAAILEDSSIQSLPDGRIELKGAPLGATEQLCPDEKFFDQLTPAICSGVLIESDKILTARHCLDRKETRDQLQQGKRPLDCTHLRILLGWGIRDPKTYPYQVTSNDLYRCESVVESYFDGRNIDYMILKLDRPVSARSRPVEISEQDPKLTHPLLLLGHPMGLPMKAVDNGSLIAVNPNSLRAKLDAYAGNSGSPVFNRTTGELLGILVEGEDDFYDDKATGCKRSRRCDLEDCQGETITRVEAISWLWRGRMERSKD